MVADIMIAATNVDRECGDEDGAFEGCGLGWQNRSKRLRADQA